ncbi:hypothetical protein [Paludisphaera mucosa]|uniref:Uncharacterized protein n=1 Tax=Paludisphaera mucosa TaxID=3030827 RepID=A0ABT6F5I2_9BACT|nr:hypothetical protein [Paludisphaera mucosa]MDG3002698.1 hypothetical protein [Paludisphaera mucosa]
MAGEFAKFNTAITRADLDAAWRDRLDDAAALDSGGRHGTAIAYRIYALEIYLKYRICLRLDVQNPLKKLEIPDLEALLVFSGLSTALYALPDPHPVPLHWTRLTDFSTQLNDLRYLPAATWTQAQSADSARWLEHPTEGVLPWLTTQA